MTQPVPGDGTRWRWVRPALGSAALIGLVALLGSPVLTDRLNPRGRSLIRSLRVAELNRQDATLLQRGYYENLMGVGRFNSRLWEVYMNRPADLPMIWETPAGRQVDNYLGVELVASQRAMLRGAALTTNRWAMRDRDYEMEKPAGALRIGLAGPSISMGWAVRDDETFENLLEDRLNVERERYGQYTVIESLNFSVPGWVPVQYLAQVEKAMTFGVDVLLLFSQDNDVERTIGRLAWYAVRGLRFPDDSVAALVEAARRGTTTASEIESRLLPHGETILLRYYRTMVEMCRQHGARPVWVFIPALERQYGPEDKALLFRTARAAGFEIMDLSDVYEGRVIGDITIGTADFHPNPEGHRIIAARLLEELRRRPELLSPLAQP